MKKGEIWEADLNPVKGSEQAGKRPVLIVSGDLLNSYAPVVWVCPITSKIKNYKGNVIVSPIAETGLKQTSEILNLHLRSISKNRLTKKLGSISQEQLMQVRKGLNEIILMD